MIGKPIAMPAPTRPAPLLVNANEAARLLAVSGRTIWSLSITGELPSVRIGRRRLYPVAALEAWIAERSGSEARR